MRGDLHRSTMFHSVMRLNIVRMLQKALQDNPGSNAVEKKPVISDESVSTNGSTATIRGVPQLNAEAAARRLGEALLADNVSGLADIDASIVIQVLTSHNNQQLQRIKRHFRALFGKELSSVIEYQLGGLFRDLSIALIAESNEYIASQIHNEIKRVRPNPSLLVEIIGCRTNAQLWAIQDSYKKKYGRSLQKAANSELTSDHFQLIEILFSARRENSEPEQAYKDALVLRTTGVGTYYELDGPFLTTILKTRAHDTIRQTFEILETDGAGPTLVELVKEQFAGDLRDGLVNLVHYIQSRPEFLADRLHKATESCEDASLIRLLVMRAEIDLKEIKEYFLELTGMKLANWISDETQGDYQRLLYKLL